jgi:NAD(P)-dependent dehydrogenase (short-subunit alcohol dehydrogenase family)
MTERKVHRRPVALITGGARGIGLGIARALAARGWDLALAGLRAAQDVQATVDGLKDEGVDVIYVVADVSRADDRARLIDQVESHFGRLNALVNNAGRAPRVRGDLLEATEASFEEVLRTNLQGPYFLTQRAAPLMVQRKHAFPDEPAAVIFVSSVSATMVSPNRGEYCVSKAGLAMAASLFAVRLAPHKVAVFEVRPGVIATDMTAGVKESYDQRIADGLIPAGRWGTAEDVGKVVAALVSGDVAYATGSVVHVDGALSVPRL